jgi:hypothetical protein
MTPAEEEKTFLALIEQGVAASAESLATVSRTKWATQTVSISADKAASVRARLKGDSIDHYGAIMSMRGAVFVMMVPKTGGPDLAKAFIGNRTRRPGAKLPREESCVAEIANVVVNAIANTLADACRESFILTAPTMILAKKSALLELAVDELESVGETFAVMTYVSLTSESLSSDCTVLLLLNPAWRTRVLQALGRR